ncbi:FAD-dependent oxidoreductase [Oscillatoria sp. FACHB-1406]|uniref:FAD-dependent oxidoreductase n=1 Tax=Oscillatoria sp. FACHB-1406 TaxID=2692846 RepID=UPI0016882651|nr:FAD-dependent oxidoreductase [Oscillatoria sp. FACHB-1406]
MSESRSENPWQWRWPNTADFNFNYYKLLEDSKNSAIARNTNPNLRIAIIGAGVAGLTAARELFRCGYTKIDIFEASDRIGGRTYSIPVEGQKTVLEMGAMRMPFFDTPGSCNSIIDYYTTRFGITTQNFPDPGSSVADTGIFINNGYGPDLDCPYPQPHLDIWHKEAKEPPSPKYVAVYQKWSNFANMVTEVAKKKYNTPHWKDFWHAVVNNYWEYNFRELVVLKAIKTYHPCRKGFFGGLGMNEEEAELFYTIGAGDGSWGAFYDISCLYPIRTLLFGFGSNHQLIQGKFNPEGEFSPGSEYQNLLQDNLGNPLASPQYLGVQSFAECLFFEPVVSNLVDRISLYQATQTEKYDINIYTRNPVRNIEYLQSSDRLKIISKSLECEYEAAILTPPTWASQLSFNFSEFDFKTQLPFQVLNSFKNSHWITSCKVFFPLKQRYWEVSNIPQIISTDTYLQGVYGYSLDTSERDAGVLLVSYTWEDDANKFIAESDDGAFARQCLQELDEILERCKNINRPISPFVDTDKPAVIHWSRKPNYRGCAKLYREMTWNEDYALLRYNQNFSDRSHLYFAGEAFSVEGGWTEPAFRSALDSAIHLIKNTGGEFNGDFNYSQYPQYDNWKPISKS